MKSPHFKKTFHHSVISFFVLGIFTFLATSSLDELDEWLGISIRENYKGNGYYEETEAHGRICQKFVRYGKKDEYGKWHGMLTITRTKYLGTTNEYVETVNMTHGIRDGLCTRKYPDGRIEEEFYRGGVKVSEGKSAVSINATSEEGSAFSLLEARYPWYLFMLEAFYFPEPYVEDYTDTIETLLGTYAFEPVDFDEYYEQVLDSLDHSRFDSLTESIQVLSYSIGLSLAKDDELRLAVIDKYRSDHNPTYQSLTSLHPSYLDQISEFGVDAAMLEIFCSDLDDTLSLYGSLDMEDPFFTDSVDSYLYSALSALLSTEDTKGMKSAVTLPKNILRSIIRDQAGLQMLDISESSDTISAYVTEVALGMMILKMLEGDLVKEVIYDTYRFNKGIPGLPLAGTGFGSVVSATSVKLNGYVIEDGGAGVDARGIAWAQHYNPTIEDQSASSGSGTGSFSITLEDLTEGQTYYARAWATNSEGTAYGNIISFVPENTVGTRSYPGEVPSLEFYPNPAFAHVTVRYPAGVGREIILTLTSTDGRMVWQGQPEEQDPGSGTCRMDVTSIPAGVYLCTITSCGTPLGKGKLVVKR
jgi:hypothetical protein